MQRNNQIIQTSLSSYAFAYILASLMLDTELALGEQGMSTRQAGSSSKLRFAMISKSYDNPFFLAVRDGCLDMAKTLAVECIYDGPLGPENEAGAVQQSDMIDTLVKSEQVDGIGVSVLEADILSEAINKSVAAGIPVVTFDSDSPNSMRMAYVGSDNVFLGEELGKTLMKINPLGGMYGIITLLPGPNLAQRTEGIRLRLRDYRSKWTEVADSPRDGQDSADIAMREMWEFAKNPEVKAILSCCGFPMANATAWKEFVAANPHISLVNGDSNQYQMDLMNQGFSGGLVGQIPFKMGQVSIRLLKDAATGKLPPKEIYRTSLLTVIQVPVDLPPLVVDDNRLGYLSLLGYLLFAVIALMCAGFTFWSIKCRRNSVVCASQPEFLILICIGCFIMASTMIPLSMDDSFFSQEAASVACNLKAWLLSIGFTTMFSAFFSKTWRINKVYHNARRFRRVVVTAKDVIVPLVVLLTANVIVLTCWAILAPMEYTRMAHPGTDSWNRIISTYAICQTHSDRKGASLPYICCLVAINFVVVCIANFQAYQARSIKTEFSESRYIALVVAFTLQAILIGVPVFALVQDEPQVMFAVATLIIFAICFASLFFIFVPKVIKANEVASKNVKVASTRGLRMRVIDSAVEAGNSNYSSTVLQNGRTQSECQIINERGTDMRKQVRFDSERSDAVAEIVDSGLRLHSSSSEDSLSSNEQRYLDEIVDASSSKVASLPSSHDQVNPIEITPSVSPSRSLNIREIELVEAYNSSSENHPTKEEIEENEHGETSDTDKYNDSPSKIEHAPNYSKQVRTELETYSDMEADASTETKNQHGSFIAKN